MPNNISILNRELGVFQRTLDAILRAHPDLAGCAVRCRRCGIRFLTHPRNADREDLRCEFGCRECHRRELANARSKKHYRTDRAGGTRSFSTGNAVRQPAWPNLGCRPRPLRRARRPRTWRQLLRRGPRRVNPSAHRRHHLLLFPILPRQGPSKKFLALPTQTCS